MNRAFLLAAGLSLALALGPRPFGVDRAWADERDRDDLYRAQVCLNETARRGYSRHHEALRCLSGIEGYGSEYAHLLKCSIVAYYGGFDFFQFPWFMEEPRTYPVIATLNYLSDVDLDEGLSAMARRSCASSGSVFAAFLSEYYWLRFSLSKVSTLRGPDVIAALATVEDDVLTAEIDKSLLELIRGCKQFSPNAPLPMPKTLFCQEVLRIDTAPGERPFDQLLRRMRAYEAEADDSTIPRATSPNKSAAVECLSELGQTNLSVLSQAGGDACFEPQENSSDQPRRGAKVIEAPARPRS